MHAWSAVENRFSEFPCEWSDNHDRRAESDGRGARPRKEISGSSIQEIRKEEGMHHVQRQRERRVRSGKCRRMGWGHARS